MPKSKYRMPNSGKKGGGTKHSDTDSGSMGSNHGKTGGLRMEKGTNQGATKKPTTTNRFPKGLA